MKDRDRMIGWDERKIVEQIATGDGLTIDMAKLRIGDRLPHHRSPTGWVSVETIDAGGVTLRGAAEGLSEEEMDAFKIGFWSGTLAGEIEILAEDPQNVGVALRYKGCVLCLELA